MVAPLLPEELSEQSHYAVASTSRSFIRSGMRSSLPSTSASGPWATMRPGGEHRDVIRDARGDVEVMRRTEHGLLALTQGADDAAQHLLAHHCVEAGKRLVEQEHFGLTAQAPRRAWPSCLRRGKARGRASPSESSSASDEAFAASSAFHVGYCGLPGSGYSSPRRSSTGSSPACREHIRPPAARGARGVRGSFPQTRISPASGLEQAQAQLHERRLPRAVASKQRRDAPALQLEVESVEHLCCGGIACDSSARRQNHDCPYPSLHFRDGRAVGGIHETSQALPAARPASCPARSASCADARRYAVERRLDAHAARDAGALGR